MTEHAGPDPIDGNVPVSPPIPVAPPPAVPVDGPGRGAIARACPYLGLRTDPASHFAYPSTAQACHAGGRPRSVDGSKQSRDCLTSAHLECNRYRPPEAVASIAAVAQAKSWQEPSLDGPRQPGRRVPTMSRAALYLLLLLLAGFVGLNLGGFLGSRGGSTPVQPRTSDVAGTVPPSLGAPSAALPSVTIATSAPTLVPTERPSASPVPSATASPTARTTPSPTPAPTPLTHIVKRGETLISIALSYGVSVKAIKRLNRLSNVNAIVVGQVLLIPIT